MHVGIPRQRESHPTASLAVGARGCRRTRGRGDKLLCNSLVLAASGQCHADQTAGLAPDGRWRNRRHKRVPGV